MKIWLGTKKCDICGSDIVDVLIDGKTANGPWATMCLDCYSKHGIGLGLGKGQQYVANENGEFVKTEIVHNNDNDYLKSMLINDIGLSEDEAEMELEDFLA